MILKQLRLIFLVSQFVEYLRCLYKCSYLKTSNVCGGETHTLNTVELQ